MLGTTLTSGKLGIFFSVLRSYELNISSNSTKIQQSGPNIYKKHDVQIVKFYDIYLYISYILFAHVCSYIKVSYFSAFFFFFFMGKLSNEGQFNTICCFFFPVKLKEKRRYFCLEGTCLQRWTLYKLTVPFRHGRLDFCKSICLRM